ncbi:MAG: pathogenicity island 1 effector protein SipB, partial [Herbaspirillum sp.]|nr:pathogenicity island 1 effector protein SipB [Herbaspirillum sp.]
MTEIMRVERGNFADNALMNEVASNAVRVSGGFVEGVNKATRSFLNMNVPVDGDNIEFLPGDDLIKPLLTPPRAQIQGRFAVTQLVAELGVILGEASVAELMGQIETFKSLAEARKKSLEHASEELDVATNEAEGAVKQFEAAHAATAAAQTAFNTAKGRVKQAQIDVAEAKSDAASRPSEAESSPLKSDDLIRAQQQLKQAQQAFLTAGKKLKEATAKEQPLYAEAKQKTGLAIDMETRALNAAAAAAVTPNHRGELEKLGSSTARLSLLLTSLSQLIGESGEASMKNDQELFKSMQAERQKTLEKAASDYEAEVRKAEQVGKTMGCIGKIVGGILTAVSLLAIPFTGGASAALAVIGVGMMAADAITTAVTGGTSLTSMAMAPIMANVIQPLIKEIGKKIAAALEIAGVPKEEAERVGNIIAMVVVAVAMLVLMICVIMVVKNSAFLNKFLTAFSKTFSKGINKA